MPWLRLINSLEGLRCCLKFPNHSLLETKFRPRLWCDLHVPEAEFNALSAWLADKVDPSSCLPLGNETWWTLTESLLELVLILICFRVPPHSSGNKTLQWLLASRGLFLDFGASDALMLHATGTDRIFDSGSEAQLPSRDVSNFKLDSIEFPRAALLEL